MRASRGPPRFLLLQSSEERVLSCRAPVTSVAGVEDVPLVGFESAVRAWALVVWSVGLLACGAGAPCDSACEPSDEACRQSACGALPEESPRMRIACDALPPEGRCLGPRVVERCVDGQLQQRDCAMGEACVEAGGAHCEAAAACVEGMSRCSDAGALERCADGRWASAACDAGCVAEGNRGFCGAPGRTLSGVARYARRLPDASFRDWAPEAEWVSARGFLVASFQGGALVDLAVTDGSGRFTVRVAREVGAEDAVVVYAAGQGQTGLVEYAVADPGLSGAQGVPATPGSSARIWSWSRPTRALLDSPVVAIEESEGSGAAAVFEAVSAAWHGTRERYGDTGLPLVAWLGFGTTWSCGACFAPWQVTAVGRRWSAQLWLPGDSDAAWWSEAMVLHELGHWAMASHGTSPAEGGPHFLGVPTFPGQAWSEGWATWFSSDTRGSPRYYDRQGGTMFWLDLETRSPEMIAWSRPRPEDGLLQPIEENEVAAILYRLGTSTPSRQLLYESLAAPAMNLAPWARGYRKHTWRMEEGTPVDVAETLEAAPCLADFLDALMCGGFPRELMDAATEPAVAYPYPSHAPLCR
ncbi:hypothetical protein OWM54_13480 [Myxococcus sp. MISCRS1]|uniref:hypothetical protein n=1 Tax=Myxococcus sp. MISCRS1 TaxID=2996786 RepID=UPI00226E3775|nr:hypothetical protein [Myxococcus sp. MISCRS1]MCY0998140.1 hypothetical protein [Myxococcus sp. MISCRS1]